MAWRADQRSPFETLWLRRIYTWPSTAESRCLSLQRLQAMYTLPTVAIAQWKHCRPEDLMTKSCQGIASDCAKTILSRSHEINQVPPVDDRFLSHQFVYAKSKTGQLRRKLAIMQNYRTAAVLQTRRGLWNCLLLSSKRCFCFHTVVPTIAPSSALNIRGALGPAENMTSGEYGS